MDTSDSQNLDDLVILLDFDRTMTCAYHKGESVPSIKSMLRYYLGPEYAQNYSLLRDKYEKFEKNPHMSMGQKMKLMEEWWEQGFDLMSKFKMKNEYLLNVAHSELVVPRPGLALLLNAAFTSNIPVVIISASGLGEAIPLFLKHHDLQYSNQHLVYNEFIWDEFGSFVEVKKPYIHSMNKDMQRNRLQLQLQNISKFKKALLFGDRLTDLAVAENFDLDILYSVCFIDKDDEINHLEEYTSAFSEVVLNDNGFKSMKEYLLCFPSVI